MRHAGTNLTRTGRVSRVAALAAAVALVGLFLVPAPATAQATRTWISGVGDDANPCSRTAPCKTFPGAISKTATGGEINVLDPGGFGAVTINKSITLNGCMTGTAGILTNTSNGILVNATSTSEITLRCLSLNGLDSNFHGIRVLNAKSVKIVDTDIYNWNRNAVSVENANPGAKVLVARSFLHDNQGNGVMVTPPNGSSANVTLRNNDIVGNACGVVAGQFGPDPAFNYASNCGTNGPNGLSAFAIVNSFHNLFTDGTGAGVFARGSNVVQRVGQNEIVGNGFGLQSVDSGNILSFGGNFVTGNGTNGAPTGPAIPPVEP